MIRRLLLTVALVPLWGICAGPAYAQDTKSPAPTTQPRALPKLAATWYAPRQPVAGRTYPIAVLLSSSDLPVDAKGPWVQMLWKANFAIVVVRPPADADRTVWQKARADQVLAIAQAVPRAVPGNPASLVVVAGSESAPLAIQMAQGYWKQMSGLVLVNALPVEELYYGVARWEPSKETWRVPIWAINDIDPRNGGRSLVLWRQIQARAPQFASLTVDPQPTPAAGPLLPDVTFASWLKLIVGGKRPGTGPDNQARGVEKRYAEFGEQALQAVRNAAGATPGEPTAKKEGPFQFAVRMPTGWRRQSEAERPYNPRGTATDEAGKPLTEEPNPFSEMYLSPAERSDTFARVFVTDWRKSAGDLLDNTASRMLQRGDLLVPLDRVERGEWTYQACVILRLRSDKWDAWPIVMAARGGTPLKPNGALIMIMSRSGAPDPKQAADLLRLLTRTLELRVESNFLGRAE